VVTIAYSADTVDKRVQIDSDPAFTYEGPFIVTANGTVTAYATDAAGNESSAQLTIANIDQASPTGTLLINGGAGWTRLASVTLAVYDQGNGATQMSFSTDNTTWSAWEPYGAAKSYTLPAGDGMKTVYVRFKDAAGNESNAEISDTIILDTIAPTAPVPTAPNTPTKQVVVTIAYSADTVAREAQIDGNPRFTYTEPFTMNANGTVTAYATDAAGNESSAQLTIASIDTTPPTGTVLISNGDEMTNVTSVTLSLDDHSTVAVQMSFSDDNANWSAWEPYSTAKAYTLPTGDGTKTVYVRLMDAAGNVSATTISDTVTLDTAPPAAIISVVSNAEGNLLTILFDTAIQPNFATTGLSLKGTAAALTNQYELALEGRAITLHLTPAISETSEVTLQVADGTFQGSLGEKVEGNTFSIFTPHVIASLKAEASICDPAFTVDDVVNAMGKQWNVVGDEAFDKYDAQFWLNLIESRNPTSQN
jgi:hypothetical protein